MNKSWTSSTSSFFVLVFIFWLRAQSADAALNRINLIFSRKLEPTRKNELKNKKEKEELTIVENIYYNFGDHKFDEAGQKVLDKGQNMSDISQNRLDIGQNFEIWNFANAVKICNVNKKQMTQLFLNCKKWH